MSDCFRAAVGAIVLERGHVPPSHSHSATPSCDLCEHDDSEELLIRHAATPTMPCQPVAMKAPTQKPHGIPYRGHIDNERAEAL